MRDYVSSKTDMLAQLSSPYDTDRPIDQALIEYTELDQDMNMQLDMV